MLKAITRAVSRDIARCELTYVERERVDYERAVGQHADYCHLLRRLSTEIITLAAAEEHPDCCFVADTAIVLDELAVIARMGAQARRGEISEVERVISKYRETQRIAPPATLDGGDVLRLGKQLFVGRSRRTNHAGIESLRRLVEPFGYRVTPVEVRGSLHLTTAASVLDDETVLVNSDWIDAAPFARFHVLDVPRQEPWAASTMRVGDAVCVEAGAPRTLELVGRHFARVEVLDISEFRKAEGSLPCLSIIFDDGRGRSVETNGSRQNKEAN